jgi:hypothetical protein
MVMCARRTLPRHRKIAAAASLLVAVSLPIGGHAAPEDGRAITCTNPANGASWQVKIDYRNATVDANPAAITDAGISWFDPKDGGNYTLDRQSGQLTAAVASSTGGYFRYAQCNLDHTR